MIKPDAFNIGLLIKHGTNNYAHLGFHPVTMEQIVCPKNPDIVVDAMFNVNSLDGTYLETAGHIVKGGPGLEALDPNKFREVLVVKLPAKREGDTISREELEATIAVARGEAGIDATVTKIGTELGYGLCFATGYTDYWLAKSGGVIRDVDYNGRSPYFAKGALQPVLDHGFTFLMGDIPSISHPEDTMVLGQFYSDNLARGINDVCICFPVRNTDRMQSGNAVVAINPVLENTVAYLCNPLMVQGKELTKALLAAEKATHTLPH